MRPIEEQQADALAKARGITIDEARELLKSAAVKSVALRPTKGH